LAIKNPDLILISEILPKAPNPIIHSALFAIPRYFLYLNFDPDCISNIRGVSLFISQSITASQVIFNDASDYIEHVWVKIKMRGSDTLLVGCIYHSPSKLISDSISSLCDLLGQLGGYSHLLICGDFNLKDITWLDYCGNTYIEPFLDMIDNLFLFQHVTEPTRYRSSDPPSFLDLVFTNELDIINDISYSPPLGNSDHVCIYFVCYTKCKQISGIKYNVGAANLDLMNETLQSVDWNSILSSSRQ